jgi:hypothetical protein
MKNDFLETLYTKLKEDLDIIADFGTIPVKRLALALSTIKEVIDKIKIYLQKPPFQNPADEIDFFKYEKPRFLSEQLYVIEIFTIESNKPVADIAALKKYYEMELLYIKRFFTQYQFLYQYFKYELKELDHLLFVVGVKPSDLIVPEPSDSDSTFSTCGDGLFAKFIAYERLQVFIIGELKSLENPAVALKKDGAAFTTELVWTGESINLVELAYGICLTGQINNGNATVTEIIEWLEEHLQVIIGTAHRRWVSISKRKRISQTKYLDQIKEAIIKRLDDENGLM